MILISIVHYNNSTEVNSFITHINRICNSSIIEVVITDNTNNLNLDAKSLNGKSKVLVNTSKTNFGYLNGCYAGIRFWRSLNLDKLMSLEYVFISNTDLIFNEDFFTILKYKKYDATIACIAPNVYLSNGVRQNPNMLKRMAKSKLLFLIFIHRIRLLGILYLMLSNLKKQISTPNLDKQVESQPIYGAHGAIMIFTHGYMQQLLEMKFDSFMQDEELHVAEEVRRLDKLIFYDSDLLVKHLYHTSTKFISLTKTSTWHYESLKMIFNKYFK